MKIKGIRRIILMSFIVLLNIGCDQISKAIVRNNINDNEIINLVKDTIILNKVENSGAAMGLGAHLPSLLKSIYFQLLPIIFLLFLFRILIVKTELSMLSVIGLAFAIGGGVGNILDRIVYGSVTDFISLKIGMLKIGIFNLADVSIIIGIILIFWEISFNKNNNLESILE